MPAAILARHRRLNPGVSHAEMNIKKGVKLIEEKEGHGDPVVRQRNYLLSIRLTLSKGEIVTHPDKCLGGYLSDKHRTRQLEPDGFFVHSVRMDRVFLIPGIFYALDGMKVGGYRKVTIAPHLAYRDKGIPDVVPPNALLTAEIKVLQELTDD